jgi:hypothetical protein
MKKLLLLFLLSFLFHPELQAQVRETAGPVYIDSAKAVHTSSFSKRKLQAPSTEYKIYNPRNRGINAIVPGKGLPKSQDPAAQLKMGEIPGRAPLITFEAASTRSTPSDPTGAKGPNHYVNGWNSAFSIFDNEGNQISPPASLASIGGEFTNETLGDPIILYDEFADRFIISQFSDTPESFLVAISQGPNPVTDGWYTYRFPTNGVLPDYPKISVWSDGYYITTNKNWRTAGETPVIYAIERDKMLEGESARVVGFPLPGIRTNGFYSPAGFNATGNRLPPRGNAPIIYLQDDAWSGVEVDHLKLWNVNMDWNSIGNSSISESQELGPGEGVSPFIATFDGGSFENISQPFDGRDIDVLQAAMMYSTQYRRFASHNSVVMNFVVDVDPSPGEHAAIRWYELRQPADGGNWQVYQEGTYAPDKSDRFCGSIGIDALGNIGLGYTVLDDSPENPIFPSLRYTGRYANDAPGEMTVEERSIIEGQSNNPSFRYGDYAHLAVDPDDGLSFWHNGEYFDGLDRKNQVGVFKIAPDFPNDVGVIALVSPTDATLGSSEEITIRIRNFGTNAQSNFEVSYQIDGGEVVTETFTGSIAATSTAEYTFSQTADLSEEGREYEFVLSTYLDIDQAEFNDTYETTVTHLLPNDVGVTSIDSPDNGQNLGMEQVAVTIENFGGMPQSNFPVEYRVNNNFSVVQNYTGSLDPGENDVLIFDRAANLSNPGRYRISAQTRLQNDQKESNDEKVKFVVHQDCIPEGSDCTYGDGIFSFELGDILNERIPCGNGYEDFTSDYTDLDRASSTHEVRVQSLYASDDDEQMSMWIDFNDNGVFEDSERVITSEVIPNRRSWHSVSFNLPGDAALGEHLLRVRAGDVSFEGDLNDPCNVIEYGTTHDYTVNIKDSNLDIEDFLLNDAELIIISEDQRYFRAIMDTDFDETLRITIHDITGRKLLENQVYNDGRGYAYEFDMSYVARGVYLVRLGTRKVGKVKRIIVK